MAQRGRSAAAGARPADRSAPRSAPPEPPVLRPQELAALRDRLRQLVEPIIVAEGLDLDELTVARAGRRYVVRITVDGNSGVGHNELTAVSRAISAFLDEAEEAGRAATPDAYTLEVSSPGVDRPLTLGRHWRRSIGRLVKVKAGDKQVTGRVVAAAEETVSLDMDGRRQEFALADLGPGRVQVEFNRLAELSDEDLGELTEDDDTEETDTEETDTDTDDTDTDDTDTDTDSDEELEDEA
jgi:ribosome maturation factor RimP